MFGISVYLSDIDDAERACADAHDRGFELVFSSLHIPEDDPAGYPALLRRLGGEARRNGLTLIVDIAGTSLAAIGLTAASAGELTRWGVHGVRVDFGIDPARIVELSRALPVYVNASTVGERELDVLVEAGLGADAVGAIHNFYPKPQTGLSARFLAARSRMLRERGIAVAAFVPGDGRQRAPLFRGLPTLEQHRGIHPLAAALELAALDVDDVFIGDPGLDPRTAGQWWRWSREHTVDLTLTLAGGDIPDAVRSRLQQVDHNRADPARDLIRLQGSRPALNGFSIPARNVVARPAGSVTVDNDLSGRYRGEITIGLRDLPADPSVTVIGSIAPNDLPLLTTIGPDQAVAFTPTG